jgi:tRNA threonylcarbamoyl adenosine modification protein (Sua5/YciO/YrdC/YwlC family)
MGNLEFAMSQYFRIHPQNPQPRLIAQAVTLIRDGAVIAYPTDSSYALGCSLGDKSAMERIRRIRQIDENHEFTLVCRDLAQASAYAQMDNIAYRSIRAVTPGAYTFVLKATHEVPRRLQTPKRKTVGVRVPHHRIAQSLLEALGEPLMSVTLILPGQDVPMSDAEEIAEALGKQVDLIIDGGNTGLEPTTVVDLVDGTPVVIRRGKGDAALFES